MGRHDDEVGPTRERGPGHAVHGAVCCGPQRGRWVPLRQPWRQFFSLVLALDAGLGLISCDGGLVKQASSSASTLRIAMESGIDTLDPQLLNETTTMSVLENMFESLVTQDANLKAVPGLASSWNTLENLTWRVHLRRGVLFHDGTELTSDDVAYSYERVMNMPSSEFAYFLNSVRSVERVDDYVVDIRLRRPYNVVVNLGSIPILPAGYMRKYGESYFAEHPVGSGPYRFAAWKPGEWVRMTAFDRYWGGRPAAFADMLCLGINSAKRRLEMLENEEVDIAAMIPPQHDAPRNYRVFVQPAPHVYHLAFDCAREKTPYVDQPKNPFLDVRVRRAFLYGIDQSQLIQRVFGKEAYSASQLVTPSVFGFNSSIVAPKYDVPHARGLLVAAGYPSGFTATLDLSHPRKAVGEELRAQCSTIGIRLTINDIPRNAFYDKIDRHDSSLYLLGWGCTSGDASELFEYCLHTPDPFSRLGLKNNLGYSNPMVDRLVDESLATDSPQRRLDLLRRAMTLVMDDLPLLPLYIGVSTYGVSRRVVYTPRLDDHILGYEATPNE